MSKEQPVVAQPVGSASALPQQQTHQVPQQAQQPVQYAQRPVYAQPQPVYAGQQPAAYPGQQTVYPGQQIVYAGQQPVYAGQQPVYAGQQPVYAGQQPVYPGLNQMQYPTVGSVRIVPINGTFPSTVYPITTAARPWCCSLKCTVVTSQVFGVLSVIGSVMSLILDVAVYWGYLAGMGPAFLALFMAMFVAGAPATASGCCLGCSRLGCGATCCRPPSAIYPGRALAMRAHQLMIAAYSIGGAAWIFTMQSWSCPYNGVMCIMPAIFCIVACSLALSSACFFGKDMQQQQAQAQAQAQAQTNMAAAQRPPQQVQMQVVSSPSTRPQPIQAFQPQQAVAQAATSTDSA